MDEQIFIKNNMNNINCFELEKDDVENPPVIEIREDPNNYNVSDGFIEKKIISTRSKRKPFQSNAEANANSNQHKSENNLFDENLYEIENPEGNLYNS